MCDLVGVVCVNSHSSHSINEPLPPPPCPPTPTTAINTTIITAASNYLFTYLFLVHSIDP